jgi:PAS domain-containing protein
MAEQGIGEGIPEPDSERFHLYDLASVGFLRLNGQGLIFDANLTTAILLGAARVTMLRQPLTRFIFQEDQELFHRHRRQILATETMQRCDLRMIKRDGSLFHARLEGTVAQDLDGTPEYRALLSAH